MGSDIKKYGILNRNIGLIEISMPFPTAINRLIIEMYYDIPVVFNGSMEEYGSVYEDHNFIVLTDFIDTEYCKESISDKFHQKYNTIDQITEFLNDDYVVKIISIFYIKNLILLTR